MAVVVVSFIGTKAVDAESTTGWNTGNLDGDIFVEGAGSIGAKVSNTTADFYDLSITGSPYDFSSGGADEGDHIFGYFNTLTPASLHAIIAADDLATDSVGCWNVGPPSGYSGGFINYVQDPAAAFNTIIQAGTASWTTGGNPAQLTGVDGFGGRHTTSTAIMGNFNNALVDVTSVGSGYRITRGDSTDADGTFADILTYESNSSNRFGGLVVQRGSSIPMLSGIIIGDTTANSHNFTDSNFTVEWLDSNASATFYSLTLEEGTGTTTVVLSNGVLKAELSSQTPLPLFDFTGLVNGTCTVTNVNLIGGRGINLDSAVTWTGGLWQDCGQISPGTSSNVTGVTILDPTNDGALLLTGQDELDDWADIVFDGAGIGGTTADAAIEVNISGAGPHTIDLDNFTFQNRVGSSVDMYFVDQGSDRTYTVNVLNGGSTPTFTKARAGDTVTVNNSVTLAINNVVPGSKISIIAGATGPETEGAELFSKPAVPASFGYVALDGTGDWVESIENVDVTSTSGDFEIIAYVRATDWTPVSAESIVSQWDSTASNRNFDFGMTTDGRLRLRVYQTGVESSMSSSVHGLTDATYAWVRVFYDQSAGQAAFYTSTDAEDTHPNAVSWTAQGTGTQTSRNMDAAAKPIRIGAQDSGTPDEFAGRIAFVTMWVDGTAFGTGRTLFEADWRTGPNFDGSGDRPDEYNGAITWSLTNATYTTGSSTNLNETFSYNFTSNQDVFVRVRKSSNPTKYLPISRAETITSTGLSVNIEQIEDTIAS